jgi:hypothetical protein
MEDETLRIWDIDHGIDSDKNTSDMAIRLSGWLNSQIYPLKKYFAPFDLI